MKPANMVCAAVISALTLSVLHRFARPVRDVLAGTMPVADKAKGNQGVQG